MYKGQDCIQIDEVWSISCYLIPVLYFNCEIMDHLPNCASLKSDDAISSTDRPMVRLFGEKKWPEVYSEHAVDKLE